MNAILRLSHSTPSKCLASLRAAEPRISHILRPRVFSDEIFSDTLRLTLSYYER